MSYTNNDLENRKEYIHGYDVFVNKLSEDGARYLERILDREMAEVFFYYAKYAKRPARFYDHKEGELYELEYLGSGDYKLEKKED